MPSQAEHRNAFAPSKISVMTAKSIAPKNSLKKLVYDALEPPASISFTKSPIVPHRQPVINILVKLLISTFIPFLHGQKLIILHNRGNSNA